MDPVLSISGKAGVCLKTNKKAEKIEDSSLFCGIGNWT
jgi:hypothetical protein